MKHPVSLVRPSASSEPLKKSYNFLIRPVFMYTLLTAVSPNTMSISKVRYSLMRSMTCCRPFSYFTDSSVMTEMMLGSLVSFEVSWTFFFFFFRAKKTASSTSTTPTMPIISSRLVSIFLSESGSGSVAVPLPSEEGSTISTAILTGSPLNRPSMLICASFCKP